MKIENLPTESSLILYQTEDEQTRIEVHLLDETVWLNQAQMCDLFDKDKRTVSEYIQNIFKEGELLEESVVRKFRTTDSDNDGITYKSQPTVPGQSYPLDDDLLLWLVKELGGKILHG